MQSEYAQQYEKLWRDHWWWQSRKQFVLHRLRRLRKKAAPTPWNILDIGCGNGLLFNDLLPFGTVHGIEPDASLVAPDGPHRSHIEVRPFDASYQPPHPLNLILMLDVLEHIQDDLAAARHVHAILAPGGIFLLTVPALMWLWSEHDEANLHFRRYTRHSLHKVLTAAGFKIQTLHYFFGWTLGPMLLRRALAPARPRRPAPNVGNGQPSQNAGTTYHVAVPPAPVNAAMYALSRSEQLTVGRWGMPIGSSLIAVAVKEV